MAIEPGDIDRILDRHRERFRRLVEQILAEERGEDPFRMPLERYRALSSDERAEVVMKAARLAGEWVDRELAAKKLAWVVVIGDRIAASSADWTAVPSPADVLAMGEAEGLVAYLFEADLIEEVRPAGSRLG